MLREDFDSHGVWNNVASIKNSVEKLRLEADSVEAALLDRILFIAEYIESFKTLGATASAMFSEPLMAPVCNALTPALQHLQQREQSPAYRNYTDQAVAHAESALVPLGAWPRPYARGAQITQLRTLYQDLFSKQAEQVALIDAKRAEIERQIAQYVREISEQRAQIEQRLSSLETQAATVIATVDGEKKRIDEVVQTGLDRIDKLKDVDEERFKSWLQERTAELGQFREHERGGMSSLLDEARGAVDKIRADEREFANISSAAGAGKLASEFEGEATTGRWLGLGLYGLGFIFLIAAAIPLVVLLFEGSGAGAASDQWQRLVIRVSLGLLGASAATVLIRLGSRFVTGSNASKRMALELRTFGPFLANVEDKSSVDNARLELVDRAFGKSYVPAATVEKEDAVPVTAFSHVIDLVKALNR